MLSSSMINCVTTVSDEGDQRQNHERDARLGEHGREIGDRQRLPEQDAAIAAFAVQRVETVEDADDEGGQHEQTRGEVVGLLDDTAAAASGRAPTRRASAAADESC